MSAILNTGALAGKVVFVTGASRGIGNDMHFRVVGQESMDQIFRCYIFYGAG